MRYFLLFALVCTALLKASSAYGCSYSPDYHSGMDNYSVYHSFWFKELDRSKLKAAVVKTKMTETADLESNKMILDTSGPNTLIKLEFDVIKQIRGESFLSHKIVPAMSTDEISNARQNLLRNMDFDFWEGLLMGTHSSDWYGDINSCGFFGDMTIMRDQYYLIVIIDDKYIPIAEPVSGPHDPFIEKMSALINDTEDNPMKIKPEYFFDQMEGYQVFDVMDCPLGTSDLDWEKNI